MSVETQLITINGINKKTLKLAGNYVYDYCVETPLKFFSDNVLFSVIFLLVTATIGVFIGLISLFILYKNFFITVFFYIYWFVLGILSTIGFGFGLQSGILFVLPFILNVYNKAIECKSTRFNLIVDNPYTCLNLVDPTYHSNVSTTSSTTTTTTTTTTTALEFCYGNYTNYTFNEYNGYNGYNRYNEYTDYNQYNKISNIDLSNGLKFDVFLKCYTVVIVWALGSAIGELPPYLIARFYESETDIEQKLNMFNKNNNIFNRLVIYFTKEVNRCIKNYSFITIVILASWPNITFDMCGLICGYYKLSLLQFLVPTIIGKVFIKATVQLLFIVYFYSDDYNFNKNPEYNYIFNTLFFIMIGFFIKSSIETCAKKQLEKTDHKINNKNKVK